MPKSAGFKISQITGKRQPFVVDVPATYSPTGKRHRKSFSTQQDAKGYVSLLKEKRRRGIEQVTFLTPHVARQAAQSNALLQPLGDTSLTDAVSVFLEAREELKSVGEVDIVAAVRHYADFKKQRSESVTFRSLMEQFEDAPTKKTRRQKAEKYRNQIRSLANRMNPLIGDHLVCDLDDKAVVAAIRKSKVNPASIAPSYRVLKAAFNFAVKRKWSGGNPVDSIDWFTHDPDDAEVPSREQASALLECARGELQAYVAICLFAGCRDSEARRLDWRDFDWEKEEIDLKAAPGKKAASGRFIRLEPNLARWLKPLCRQTGRVCGFTDGQ
ncbi:MAG: site-specific integrase, partial [Verrucomicrobiales bacterium]